MNDFANVYEDKDRADSYSRLEFPGSYYLAFRDLPALIREHVPGQQALDFGCGAGRSTRFLRGLGFAAEGVDISASMLQRAREIDPTGSYRQVPDGNLEELPDGAYHLVLSAFTFDNIPTLEKKVSLLGDLGRVLKPGGVIINLVSAPEIYVNEWASFSTRDFPENRQAVSGDTVRIVMLDVPDRRPVEDIFWTDEDYARVYRMAGLTPLLAHRPLGRGDEPFEWVSEISVSPWVIYVLQRAG